MHSLRSCIYGFTLSGLHSLRLCDYGYALFLGSANGDFLNLDCRQTHTDGNSLTFFAADSNALIELEIIADGRDVTKNGRAIADQRSPLTGAVM